MKDKEGNKITGKEFLSRWKEGIEGITPLQKIKTQITATRIQLLGLICGLIVTGIAYKTLWWVAIVLIGALINTGVQYLGLTQQRNSLKKHEDNCEEMSLDDLMKDEEINISLEGKEQGGMSECVKEIEDDYDWILKGLDEEEEIKAKEELDKIKTKGGKTC
jgi:hypothetical protein